MGILEGTYSSLQALSLLKRSRLVCGAVLFSWLIVSEPAEATLYSRPDCEGKKSLGSKYERRI